SEGEELADEGCLSIPGYFEKVRRAYRVQLKAQDREGKDIRIEAEGLTARLFQHEIDHLNGVLMLDHLSSLKRNIFIRKFKKKQKYAESK
ncbi:MAG: peptide deformylase, partial [Nitrospirota bacterium]|nr:peptide deformylase [Nitrospirota bacterium]